MMYHPSENRQSTILDLEKLNAIEKAELPSLQSMDIDEPLLVNTVNEKLDGK